ncbi:MAG: pteridine reductase [Xanthomonadaceae bacterium]|nr:pteridine reductase [Xanthomonadaceae bacterium]
MSDDRRIALVTGGARRVGAAIVRELHHAGVDVVIHCNRSAAPAEALAAELNAVRAASAFVEQADLLTPSAAASLVARAAGHRNRLDVVVNNASSFYPTPVGTVTDAQWDDLLGTNLRAPFFVAQAAAPLLAARGGAIVNIIDIHARRPLKGHLVYSVAKAGLASLTYALARELGPEVRVNGVSPGAVEWPESGLDAPSKQAIIAASALKRRGQPSDVAGIVRFLALDAPFVTGQVIAVDGGRSIGWD